MLTLTKERFKVYCEVAVSKPIIHRALKVSLIVGTLLNLINQGTVLLTLDFTHIHVIKYFLTYLVPYGVTTYTATAMRLEFQIGTKAVIETDLKCKGCQAEIHVEKDSLIPECSSCGLQTKWRLK